MEQTLLLNATYEPLKVVHWQKAVTLWCQGKVEVISVYDREVRSVSFSFKLPSVIRLLRYIRIRRAVDYAFANQYRPDQFGPIDEELALLKKVEEGLAEKYRLRITNHNLQFHGFCDCCTD
jgi:hypothetical protein